MISCGRGKETLTIIVPCTHGSRKKTRKIGLCAGEAMIRELAGFEMTDQELLEA